MPNDEWDDFALTQKFREVDRRQDSMEHAMEGLSHFPVDIATAALNIDRLTATVNQCDTNVQKLYAIREQDRRDRTVQFRWLIGTVIAATAVIVAAGGIFLS